MLTSPHEAVEALFDRALGAQDRPAFTAAEAPTGFRVDLDGPEPAYARLIVLGKLGELLDSVESSYAPPTDSRAGMRYTSGEHGGTYFLVSTPITAAEQAVLDEIEPYLRSDEEEE